MKATNTTQRKERPCEKREWKVESDTKKNEALDKAKNGKIKIHGFINAVKHETEIQANRLFPASLSETWRIILCTAE